MANLQIAEGISIDSNPGFGYSPGDIIMLNSNTVPTGFLACNGSTITQNAYPSLFSVLGTYYDVSSLVCKLPNLNAQANWTFPCSTVGNEAAYGGSSLSHTHTTVNATVNADNYSTIAHNHNSDSNSNNTNTNHGHSGTSGAVTPNVSSNLQNRSNGSGQGANLAIYGHNHSAGYNFQVSTSNYTHYHGSYLGIASAASNHSHSATFSTTTNNTSYVPANVISMRYYIKW